jgi:predicted metal-dependent enzyme (double-stranded beta helix superfamily)
VRELVSRVVSDPTAVVAGLGEPRRAEVRRLYSAADLTILNVIWGPRMTIMPHNHLMWAVIGIYTGREANIFRRRLTDEPGGRVEAAGAKSLGERDAEPLDMEKNLRLFEDANQANANQNLSLVSAYPELPICRQGIRRTGVTC